MRLVIFALAVAVGLSLRAAEERLPLFNALLTVGREHRIVIVSPTGRVSSWLREGETFEGFTVRRFDPTTGVLVLAVEHGGGLVQLRLVPEAATLSAPVESPALLAEAGVMLERIRFERMLDKLLAQVKQAQLARVAGQMAERDRPDMPKEELGALKRERAERLLAALDAADVRAGVAQSYREMFSPEELSALAAFYNAPIAEKLAEAQAEIFSTEETAALAAFRESSLGRKFDASRAELQRKVEGVIESDVTIAKIMLYPR